MCSEVKKKLSSPAVKEKILNLLSNYTLHKHAHTHTKYVTMRIVMKTV